jgi:stage V sporulation protein G
MEITEVRIKLMEDPSDRLCAFCSITLDDCFVVRDLKIIQGAKGAFVAMPSRKLSDRCPKCHSKNQIRASFCNQCGVKLHPERAHKDDAGRSKLYADIAHPINSSCRDMIQKRVIAAFDEELVRAKQAGYICSYDDYEEERFAKLNESESVDPIVNDENEISSLTPQKTLPQESTPPVSSGTSMNLETEDGRLLRVDSQSKLGSNTPEKCEEPSEKQCQKAASSDSFGDGII